MVARVLHEYGVAAFFDRICKLCRLAESAFIGGFWFDAATASGHGGCCDTVRTGVFGGYSRAAGPFCREFLHLHRFCCGNRARKTKNTSLIHYAVTLYPVMERNVLTIQDASIGGSRRMNSASHRLGEARHLRTCGFHVSPTRVNRNEVQ